MKNFDEFIRENDQNIMTRDEMISEFSKRLDDDGFEYEFDELMMKALAGYLPFLNIRGSKKMDMEFLKMYGITEESLWHDKLEPLNDRDVDAYIKLQTGKLKFHKRDDTPLKLTPYDIDGIYNRIKLQYISNILSIPALRRNCLFSKFKKSYYFPDLRGFKMPSNRKILENVNPEHLKFFEFIEKECKDFSILMTPFFLAAEMTSYSNPKMDPIKIDFYKNSYIQFDFNNGIVACFGINKLIEFRKRETEISLTTELDSFFFRNKSTNYASYGSMRSYNVALREIDERYKKYETISKFGENLRIVLDNEKNIDSMLKNFIEEHEKDYNDYKGYRSGKNFNI